MKGFLPPKLRLLKIPIYSLVVLVIMFVVVFKVGVPKIISQRQEIAQARQKEQVLREKAELLSQIEDSIFDQATSFSYALPDVNPALSVFSQLKNVAFESEVLVDNLKIGSEVEDKRLSWVDMSFDVQGAVAPIIAFLGTLKDIAPVVTVQKVRLTQSDNGTKASCVIRTYWSAFPTTLPAVSEASQPFTKDELALIDRIAKLKPPTLIKLLPAVIENVKTNPF